LKHHKVAGLARHGGEREPREVDELSGPVTFEPAPTDDEAPRTGFSGPEAMEPLDLEATLFDLDYPTLGELRQLKALGVTPRGLTQPDFPKRARIVFVDERLLFDFAGERGVEDDGEAALIFLARDATSEPLDLIAWEPRSDRLGAWTGRAAVLGMDCLWAPRIGYDGALPVFKSPLAWLQAERAGVVIVDPERAWPVLRDAGMLMAETIDHGEELDRIFNRARVRIVLAASTMETAT
jgi:hypothetical protein